MKTNQDKTKQETLVICGLKIKGSHAAKAATSQPFFWQLCFYVLWPIALICFWTVKFASDASSTALIGRYTSDPSGSGSVLFLPVLFVVTPFFAFVVACWTLCLENPRGSEWCCLLQFPLTQTSSGDRAVCSLKAWGTWGWGVLVSSVSAAFTHLPPDSQEEPSSIPVWRLDCLPGPLLGRSWSPQSPEHREGTDAQRSAGLGRVLGTCSVPPFFLGSLVSDVQPDLSGLHSNFCLPSPGSRPEPCQPVPLLDLSSAFSPRVGFAQMPWGKAWPSQSLCFPLVWNLRLWLPGGALLNCI